MIELECPNCGANLKKVSRDTCQCTYCNALFLIDKTQDQVVAVPKPQPAPKPKPQPKTNPNPNIGIIIATFVAMIICVCLLGVFAVYENYNSYHTTNKNTAKAEEEAKAELLKSPFFLYFAEQAFGKNIALITKEDLATVTMFHFIEKDDKITVVYKIGKGEEKSLLMPEDLRMQYEDFASFTGIEDLDLSRHYINESYASSLSNLKRLVCGNDPATLSKLLPNPEGLISLNISYNEPSIDGIEAFYNLQELCVSNYDAFSAAPISALVKLEQLEIDADKVENLSTLGTLKKLKSFSIDSENTKDLSFVGEYTKLEKLTLCNTKIVNLNFFEKLEKLTSLSMSYNHELDSYEAIELLGNLEELELHETMNRKGVPDYNKLANLKSLTLTDMEGMTTLSGLSQLETLNLLNADKIDLRILSPLENLKTLQIRSSYGNAEHLEALCALPNLEVLDLHNAELLCDATDLFCIPTLKELNLNQSQIGLDPTRKIENSALKVLRLNEVQFGENISFSDYYGVRMFHIDDIEIKRCYEFLSQFTNLEELYMQSDKLETVEFMRDFAKLRVLDITDNYVTDLSPLEGLTNLTELYKEDNPL